MNERIVPIDVVYYRTSAGREPVRKYVEALPAEERAFVENALDDLRVNGFSAPTVALRQIDGKLWEVKVSAHRVFYVVVEGTVMVLLHAYKKQGQKAPRRHIDVDRKRMKEVLEHG